MAENETKTREREEADMQLLSPLRDAMFGALRESLDTLLSAAYYKGALMGLEQGCASSDKVIEAQNRLLNAYSKATGEQGG